MELRDIEIFLVLAEELHFGRTAQRLHVTQARVSQAIKQQERQLKAVGAGQAVIAGVAEAARFYPWPDLLYLPIRDAPPIEWALVWQTSTESRLQRALAQAVLDLRDA
ncbi:LysR family transcriptional regulator [Actinoplanes sp. NPDC026623]|uniref:LysR family transcriptional regulator n=1 Tax=Actinoplanes sp. NPDC026623 TaxID=3155610 RepID=UPI0034114D98